MRNERLNDKGYSDPTAYKAITGVDRKKLRFAEMYRPLVYICSPYRGDVERNAKRARAYSKFAVRQGVIPLTPHLLYPQFMDDNDPTERYLATYKFNKALLKKCSEIWVFGSIISEGMKIEIDTAKRRGMKIRFFNEDCKEVKSHA